HCTDTCENSPGHPGEAPSRRAPITIRSWRQGLIGPLHGCALRYEELLYGADDRGRCSVMSTRRQTTRGMPVLFSTFPRASGFTDRSPAPQEANHLGPLAGDRA